MVLRRPGQTGISTLVAVRAGGLSRRPAVQVGQAASGIAHLQWWDRGRVTWSDLLRIAPLFVVGGAIRVADLLLNRSLGVGGVGGFGYSLIERALIAARASWFYVGKLFWPSIRPASTGTGRCARPICWRGRDSRCRGAGGGSLAAAPENRARAAGRVTVLWRYVGPRSRLRGFPITCWFPSSRTAISISQVSASPRWLSRRRQGDWWHSAAPAYCPATLRMGCSLFWSWPYWARCRGGARVCTAMDPDSSLMSTHVISYNPTARDAHLNLGSELLSRNRLDEALDAYRIAEEQRPDDCKPPYGVGLTLYQLGRWEEAEVAYLRALELCPRYGKTLTDLRSCGSISSATTMLCGLRQPHSRPAPQRRSVGAPGPRASTSGKRRPSSRQHQLRSRSRGGPLGRVEDPGSVGGPIKKASRCVVRTRHLRRAYP